MLLDTLHQHTCSPTGKRVDWVASCTPAGEGLAHGEDASIRVPLSSQQAADFALAQMRMKVHHQMHLWQQPGSQQPAAWTLESLPCRRHNANDRLCSVAGAAAGAAAAMRHHHNTFDFSQNMLSRVKRHAPLAGQGHTCESTSMRKVWAMGPDSGAPANA